MSVAFFGLGVSPLGASSLMADFIIHVGSQTAQGKRENNEDRFVADPARHVFLVADGMGGQEHGEKASGLAAEIIPRVLNDQLNAHEDAGRAVQIALQEAHKAILSAGLQQNTTRKMGTTAVLALQLEDQVWVAGVGDSPAYLIRGNKSSSSRSTIPWPTRWLATGPSPPIRRSNSPWRNVLYKFLGCAEMSDGAEVRPLSPLPGDSLLLASDGLTNFITHDDLREGARRYHDPQKWADVLVQLALDRGSRDNVTCVIVAFDAAERNASGAA